MARRAWKDGRTSAKGSGRDAPCASAFEDGALLTGRAWRVPTVATDGLSVRQTIEALVFKGRQNLLCVHVIEDQCLNVVDEALQ